MDEVFTYKWALGLQWNGSVVMRHISIICGAACLLFASGCSPYHCLWGKRASEQKCPTDIRQANCWCFGEDAIFHGPCGPGEEFYGHQPTDWREWPASGADWRDVHCGSPVPLIPYKEGIPVEEELLHAPSAYMHPESSVAREDGFDKVPPVLNDPSERASLLLDNGANELPPRTRLPLKRAAQQTPPTTQEKNSSTGQSPLIKSAVNHPPDSAQPQVVKVEGGPVLAAEVPPKRAAQQTLSVTQKKTSPSSHVPSPIGAVDQLPFVVQSSVAKADSGPVLTTKIPPKRAAEQTPPTTQKRTSYSGPSPSLISAVNQLTDSAQPPVSKAEGEPMLVAEIPSQSAAQQTPPVTQKKTSSNSHVPSPIGAVDQLPDSVQPSVAKVNRGPELAAEIPPQRATQQTPTTQTRTSTRSQSSSLIGAANHLPHSAQPPVAKAEGGPALAVEIPPTKNNRRQAWQFQQLIIEGPSQPVLSVMREPSATVEIAFSSGLPSVDGNEKPVPVNASANRAPDSEQANEKDTSDLLRRLISIPP